MIDMVVDGNSLYARSWFATSKDDPNPTEALRVTLLTLISLLNPVAHRIGIHFDRTLFCWDGNRKPEKKRDSKPREYYETREVLKDILTYAFGAAHGESPKYEGDDVVATAVYNISNNHSVYIVSGDKDLMQLQGQNVRYYCLNNKSVLSREFILNKWSGIKEPSHIGVALAIIGDPVDGIKGVPRYGPAKVKKLFAAVPRGMPFDKVIETIDGQIPNDLKPFFYESLDRTLLHTDLQGVPEPAPLTLLKPDKIESIGIPIYEAFRQLYHAYGAPAGASAGISEIE